MENNNLTEEQFNHLADVANKFEFPDVLERLMKMDRYTLLLFSLESGLALTACQYNLKKDKK